MFRLLPVVAAAVIGGSLSFATYSAIAEREDRAAGREFAVQAANLASSLQAGLDKYFEKVVTLRALFDSTGGDVSRSRFEVFADHLLHAQKGILSVSWIPRVNRDQRAAHELSGTQDGLNGYHIQCVALDGSLTKSPEKDEYYPVYYTAKKPPSDFVSGVDLAGDRIRGQPLISARDRDQLASSAELTLQSGAGDRRGFFVVLPVYRPGLPHDSVESRRRNLMGFVQGVFQTSAMVETILSGIRIPANLYILASVDGDEVLAVDALTSKLTAQAVDPRRGAEANSGMHWSGKVTVADRQWEVIAVPPAEGTAPGHATAWSLLAAGLLVTAICVAFMWSSFRHADHLVQASRKVSELAETDVLTSLLNRRAFLDKLSGLMAASRHDKKPFAMLFIDLDEFKDVNDTLGHGVGDVLLRQVAARLKASVRKSDVVARVGGDEFAVLLTGAIADAEVSGLATKIIEILAVPYVINGNDVCLTASIGVSINPDGHSQPNAMMVQADLALYRAKENGRNCFSFHSGDLDQKIRERVVLGEELRVAIERRALELHYQPQVEIVSGRIVGLEALVRWNHPKRGFIPPSIFIPVAEKTGAITQLGRWVFDEACRQARVWQGEGIAPAAIGVNVSTIQCKRSDIVKEMSESLARWDVDPATMEIELTESVLMEVTQQHCDIMEGLRKLGLRIAIDDFGTGYSTLSYLTNYPVDRLKIAQELVLHVSTDGRHASVVRAAIRLAHELEIQVIAEGVETEAQAHFLISADCGYAQGYHYSRPVTAEHATVLLRQGILKPGGLLQRKASLTAA